MRQKFCERQIETYKEKRNDEHKQLRELFEQENENPA